MAGDLADRGLGRIDCFGRDEFGQPAGVDPYLPLVNRLERPVGQPHRWGGFHQAVVGLAQATALPKVVGPPSCQGVAWCTSQCHIGTVHPRKAQPPSRSATASRSAGEASRWARPTSSKVEPVPSTTGIRSA